MICTFFNANLLLAFAPEFNLLLSLEFLGWEKTEIGFIEFLLSGNTDNELLFEFNAEDFMLALDAKDM